MLAQPRILYDSKSEVIKGQTIDVKCQSINGTSPISYVLVKARRSLKSLNVSSNEPAVFKDNPTQDTEYQCIARNCHSHSEMFSDLLSVKVIGKLPFYEKKSCGIGALYVQRFGVAPGRCGQGKWWDLCEVHKNDMWQSRIKAQVNGVRKYLGTIGVASVLSPQNLSSELLKCKSDVSQLQEALKLCFGVLLAFAPL